MAMHSRTFRFSLCVICILYSNVTVSAKVKIDLSEVNVVNEKCKGVQSKIYHMHDDESDVLIGLTAENGILKLDPPESLERNAELYAIPEQDLVYHNSFPELVKEKLNLVVYWRGPSATADSMIVVYSALADGLRRGGKYHYECSIETSNRIIGVYDQLAYEAAAAKFGLDSAGEYDEDRGEFLVSGALRGAIRQYQRSNALPATGSLNVGTVDSMVSGRYLELYWKYWREHRAPTSLRYGPWETLPDGYGEYLGLVGDQRIADLARVAWGKQIVGGGWSEALRFLEVANGLRGFGSEGALWLADAADRESLRAIVETLRLMK